MKALLLVDIQNDFLPGGALPVAEGDAVIPVANTLLPHFDLSVATQDWHPAKHLSFAANHGRLPGEITELQGLSQVLWPVHCVERTLGASFASDLKVTHIHHVIRKGIDPNIDSYSGFFDNGQRRATGLRDLLMANRVDEVYILGLATDYCVKYTALDARRLGFTTHLIVDGCRGVDLQPGDVTNALAEMKQAGVLMTYCDQLVGSLKR